MLNAPNAPRSDMPVVRNSFGYGSDMPSIRPSLGYGSDMPSVNPYNAENPGFRAPYPSSNGGTTAPPNALQERRQDMFSNRGASPFGTQPSTGSQSQFAWAGQAGNRPSLQGYAQPGGIRIGTPTNALPPEAEARRLERRQLEAQERAQLAREEAMNDRMRESRDKERQGRSDKEDKEINALENKYRELMRKLLKDNLNPTSEEFEAAKKEAHRQMGVPGNYNKGPKMPEAWL